LKGGKVVDGLDRIREVTTGCQAVFLATWTKQSSVFSGGTTTSAIPVGHVIGADQCSTVGGDSSRQLPENGCKSATGVASYSPFFSTQRTMTELIRSFLGVHKPMVVCLEGLEEFTNLAEARYMTFAP
jgi:hypothetical protein